MRVRYDVVVLAALTGLAACSDPSKDFDDDAHHEGDVGPQNDAGSFDAGALPSQAVEGTYYGACLTELALGQTNRVFNFWVESSFAPSGSGGQLSLKLTGLALSEDQGPPKTVSKAGAAGDTNERQATGDNVGGDGRFTLDFGTVNLPGEVNPVTGRPVVILGTKLTGFFGEGRFCAQLNGDVTQPIQITLDPPQNICQFVPIKDGDATPTFTLDDFKISACPF